ncbi:MAG: hypothetical protein R2712_10240 [Vicinamibacterales bacterium]
MLRPEAGGRRVCLGQLLRRAVAFGLEACGGLLRGRGRGPPLSGFGCDRVTVRLEPCEARIQLRRARPHLAERVLQGVRLRGQTRAVGRGRPGVVEGVERARRQQVQQVVGIAASLGVVDRGRG